MKFLEKIQNFFDNLDQQQFRNYIVGLFAALFLITGFFGYRYFTQINYFKRRIASTNRKRLELKELLTRYEIVKRQQADVDALLAKDKDFKIAGYFNDVINKLGITQNKTREPETSSEVLDNGYTEIKLYASFSNFNTQKIVQLLDTLEQNERIYIKEVEIYKPNGNTLNLNILLATLEPKPITPAATE